MSTVSDDWDPLSPEALRDPHATHATLRARCPVAHSDRWGGFWTLTKYQDILAASSDSRTFISSVQHIVPMSPKHGLPRMPLVYDPPLHTRYRRALNPYLEPELVTALEADTRAVVVRFLLPLLAKGRGDFAREFTHHVPIHALCVFLHVADSDARLIDDLSKRYMEAIRGERPGEARGLSDEMDGYAKRLVAERQAQPLDATTDVTSGLLATQIDGEPLQTELVAGAIRFMLVGGHFTVSHVLASAAQHLAEQPDLHTRLRREPRLIPSAVEEFLRLYSPTQAFARTPTRDITIRGRTVRRGEPVALLWASANRDSDAFARPEAFELDRDPNPHIAFGHGVHKCPGAPFARLQLRVALEEVVARTERLVLDGPRESTWWPEYGPTSLPVAFVI